MGGPVQDMVAAWDKDTGVVEEWIWCGRGRVTAEDADGVITF